MKHKLSLDMFINNKFLFIILSSALFLLIAALTTFIIIKENVKIYIVDGNKVNVKVFDKYNDPGIKVKVGKRTIKPSKYKLEVKGKVNTNIIGKYEINYKGKYFAESFNLTKVVNVIDDVKPEIEINTDVIYKDYCTKKYQNEIKYTATDNYDGDITNKVEVKEEENKITYAVADTSGNMTIKTVKIDYENKPTNKFYLNGSSKTYVVVNTSYNEKGASYTDGCGNKINKEIKITGEVDPTQIGEYTIKYEVANEEPIIRTVIVRERPPKTIYLTFDDGPGANTKKVLETLDKYNVKATFFVTDQFPNYEYLIKEEYDKGHSVGVHTLTHKWDIYDSLDAYINDFNAMNEIIKTQTGSYTKIFRFPGGSGNTVSKSHKVGVVTEIANEMTQKGYVYFDWNLSSGDASSGKVTSEKIKNNVLNNIDKCSAQCVILFHDYKSATANAIEPIISELVDRGYAFATLDENGPTVHATIKN